MKTEKLTLLVETEINFQCEQDRKNAIAYAKHLIFSISGTGVKFTAIRVRARIRNLIALFWADK